MKEKRHKLRKEMDKLNIRKAALEKKMAHAKSKGLSDSMWDDRLGDSKLEFSTAQFKRVSISSSSICDSESTMKKSGGGGSDAVDPETYLNIWICPLEGGLLGYAYYPCLLGVVVNGKMVL